MVAFIEIRKHKIQKAEPYVFLKDFINGFYSQAVHGLLDYFLHTINEDIGKIIMVSLFFFK